jgi:8-oxo-dGTP pyrophosphatase MutT (NUDIX family)
MTKKPASLKTKTSSGGVVYRKNAKGFEVILIKIKNGTVFTLPKGSIDDGESIDETALREVREETGVNGEIEEELGNVSYWFYAKGENIKYKKTVHYFLLRYVSGDTADHDAEVEDAVWIELDKALELVMYKTDRQILQKVKEILSSRE